ncbi:FkbM family methyltransferase [Paraburkholderia sp. RL17-337-BIB-A]|uniref:FkbM family methyltransferase n=1 Tax=Paraburkholderia sp. RL17-337-BIB-A TaxID=3031636 RepID=UPI0038B9E81C
MVDKLQLLGVDELACLIDFGVDSDVVLGSLKHLDDLRRVVSERSGAKSDGLSIAAQIRRHNVTHLQCTPSLARMMVADPETRETLKTLQFLLVGGEALPFDLARSLRDAVGGLVFNMYGPTETTIWSSVWNLLNLEDRVSVGTPIANTQFYVLSEHGQLAPTGVSGELHIGGKGIARGYWKRSELTSERFIADPFRNATNARLYRTGDLARRLASGDIEILGRIDSQTKIRGFRIELEEIETILNEAAEVAESVAVVREDEAGDRRLAAYIRLVEPIAVPTLQINEAVKATSDPARLIELPNGLEVFHHDAHQTHGIADEVFTNHDYLQHGITYYEGDCIFDVGMNIGLFALFAHQQCQKPVVYGFEPIPPTFDIARRNFELYSLDVRLFNCALSDEEGTAQFTFYPEMSGLSSQFGDPKADIDEAKSMFFHLLDHNEHDERRRKAAVPDLRDLDALMQARYSATHFDCALRTLSSVIDANGIDRIDLLKIDVEKAEGHVLRGIRQEHWARIRQMVVEVHSGALLQEVTGLLSTHHFEFFIRDLFRIPPADGRASVDIFLIYAFNPAMDPRCATQSMGADRLTMQLRQRLKEKLPSYMVPGEIHLVPEIPRTPNGKVDRAVLALDRKCGRSTRAARVEPRTETERKMASMWARLLNVSGVGIYDNFFELGGHSLLATQLLFMIRDELGVNVSLQTLMQQDTIAALAESVDKLSLNTCDVHILASLDKVAGEPFFPLTSFGGKNLFLVPGTTGNPLAYRPLAKYLEGKIRLFGCITHHVLDFDHGSIEAMASELTGSVSRLHPVGPVHLAGHSFGAVVVFEMARQLGAQGRTVGSLTLIDLPAPGSADFRFKARDDIDWLVDIGTMAGTLSGKNILLERQALEKLEQREQLQLVLRQFQQEKIVSESASLDLIETLWKTHRRSLDILLAYQAVYCDVDLVVIHGNSSSSGADGALGWSGLTGGKVRAVKVAGDHVSMIAEPHVRELAAELIKILR